jgi:hypothetical protein
MKFNDVARAKLVLDNVDDENKLEERFVPLGAKNCGFIGN